MNNSLQKSSVLHISVFNFLDMKHRLWYNVHFRVVYSSNLKHWAAKWQNPKRHNWLSKCLSMRLCDWDLSQFDFLEETFN